MLRRGLGIALLTIAATTARADVRLPAILSDHAVLQANKPVSIWGWASPSEKVRVEIAGASGETQAGADGQWLVKLPVLPAGGPHTLKVQGNNNVHVDDVLIGEVWLFAGQSNIAMQIRGLYGEVKDADTVIAQASHPTIRQFVHDKPYGRGQTTVPPAEPADDQPGKWVVCSPESVAKFSAMGYFVAREIQEQTRTPVGVINAAVGGTPIEAWTSRPAQEAVAELKPLLNDWKRRLKDYDPQADRKRATSVQNEWLQAKETAVAKKQPEPERPREAAYVNRTVSAPGALFNGIIAPISRYTLRGVVWYQGEANALGRFSPLYGQQLQTLIGDWRKRWDDNLYFNVVQIPDHKEQQSEPSEDDGWAVWVRDGQRRTLAKTPNASMTITLGLGGVEADYLHPQNKQDFAKRVSVQILNDLYDMPAVLRSGPLYKEMKREGNRVVLSFNFAEGLSAKGGANPAGFAIAGADQRFVWANAEIRGQEVIVWSDKVTEPAAVRYGWAANPIGDLQNSANLPASPFRTDNWPTTNTP